MITLTTTVQKTGVTAETLKNLKLLTSALLVKRKIYDIMQKRKKILKIKQWQAVTDLTFP